MRHSGSESSSSSLFQKRISKSSSSSNHPDGERKGTTRRDGVFRDDRGNVCERALLSSGRRRRTVFSIVVGRRRAEEENVVNENYFNIRINDFDFIVVLAQFEGVTSKSAITKRWKNR